MPRQLRRIAAVAVLAASATAAMAAVATAARPEGAPTVVRAARAADHGARPSALQEWWKLHLVDPRSAASIEIRARRSRYEGETGIGLTRSHPNGFEGPSYGSEIQGVAATGRRLTAGGADASLDVRLRPRGATVDLAAPWGRGRLQLVRARRGPAALGFRLGTPISSTFPDRITWNWALPIAHATARGALDLLGERFDVSGWKVAYEHGWGNIPIPDNAYDYWDSWIVHRGSATWVAHGLNRQDSLTGPGARDGQWLGILARATARGVRVCRPRVHRRGWRFVELFEMGNANRLEARCGGLRARFTGRGGSPRVNGRGRGTLWQLHTPD